MSATSRSSAPATPRIGWFTATCLLVSNMIGGGIFATTGFMTRELGDARMVLLLWVVGAAVAVAGALSYAELPAALPRAGGDYVYVRAAYGSLTGFLSGWVSFTVGFGAGIAAGAVGFASYALRLWRITEQPAVLQSVALALVWIITAIHLRGVHAGGALQRWLTTTKVAAIVLFILAGALAGHGSWAHFQPATTATTVRAGPIIISLVFVLYTYLGWNVVGYIAGEIREPQRTIPAVVIGGTVLVAILYVGLNVVYFYALPVDVMAAPPLLPVAEKAAAALWGPAVAQWVALLLCLAIAGGVSAMIWAGPRTYWAMAQDGVFSPLFAAVSHTGVPIRAMMLQSAWASALIVTGTFEQLVVFSGLVLAAFTALTLAATIVLRIREPHLHRPYRIPFYPVVPIFAIAVLLVIVVESFMQRPTEALFGMLITIAGLPLYLLWRRPAVSPSQQPRG